MDRLGHTCRTYAKKEAKGSTLIEVLVASVIFLCIFAISLETAVRITTAGPGRGYEYIFVMNAVEEAREKYTSGLYGPSVHEEESEWGKIHCAIEKYEDYDNILRLTVTVMPDKGIKKLTYDYLFETVE